METLEAKGKICNLLKSVKPFDQAELECIASSINWIRKSENIYRNNNPKKHLVTYSVATDTSKRKILLLDHKKSLLKLPNGGHPEENEMPYGAAKREFREELGLPPEIYTPFKDSRVPFFVTSSKTVGISKEHTDVSLWYMLRWNSENHQYKNTPDFKREFNGSHHLTFEEILSTPINQLNPEMHRFIKKLEKHFI